MGLLNRFLQNKREEYGIGENRERIAEPGKVSEDQADEIAGKEPSRVAGGMFFFDPERKFVVSEKHGSFGQRQRILRYDQIRGFQLVEEPQPPASADVKTYCTSLYVHILLDDDQTPELSIPFITTKTRAGGFLYRTNKAAAEQLIEALTIASGINSSE